MDKLVSFLIRLGVWSLLLMIPLHFALLFFGVYLFGAIPAAFFFGLSATSFGLAFIVQFAQAKDKSIPELGMGVSIFLVGVSTAAIFSYGFVPAGILLIVGIIGSLGSGLAAR